MARNKKTEVTVESVKHVGEQSGNSHALRYPKVLPAMVQEFLRILLQAFLGQPRILNET